MKTHNTISITVDGLDILVTAKAFSVDGGREWRVGLEDVASGVRAAVRAAMTEAARLGASDPEILAAQRRPTPRPMPACNEDIVSEDDKHELRETLRPGLPQDLIPTVVPPWSDAPRLGEDDDALSSSEVPTVRPPATDPVRSEQRPTAGGQASPSLKLVSGKD